LRVALTGATGLIGSRLVARLRERGDEVTVLSRDPDRARRDVWPVPSGIPSKRTARPRSEMEVVGWDPMSGPAPAEALAGREGVVHLAGEPIAQRWSADVKRRIRDSREAGTRHLIAGLAEAQPRPSVLVSASGVDYYPDSGDREMTEDDPPGEGFLADVCRAWEAEAQRASDLGVRVVRLRTGVVLSREGGALAKMLPPFRLGVGGPVAGGRQWMSWIHLDDIAGMYVAALDDERWSGPVNAGSPQPATNRDFSRALGRALRRPAFAPVPAFALRLLYGDMAQIVTTGRRAVPARALDLGYEFVHPDLDEALRSALA
jgi:uncharacterized protein (TIGR01777 family)